METENINKPPVRKYFLISVLILVMVFLVYYSVMNILGPIRKLRSINEEYTITPDVKNKIDEHIYADSIYLGLLKERSFLQSRIAMAQTDSIYLTVNIPDSVVNLEISGVVVHNARIKEINISKIIRAGNEYIISSMLGKPFFIQTSYSTIPREPLMIKMAPKDTSEFVPDVIPDTANYDPVNFVLEMSNGTRLFVYQAEFLHPGDKIHQFKFDLRYRLQNALNSMKSIILFKVPEYHPFIKIMIPRADARIIYRALPVHGQIAIYR